MIRDLIAYHAEVAAHVSKYEQHLSVNDLTVTPYIYFTYTYLIFSVHHVYISCLQFFNAQILYLHFVFIPSCGFGLPHWISLYVYIDN